MVGVFTQLLYWVHEASGVYVSKIRFLFYRPRRTTNTQDSTLQNAE